MLSQHSKQSLLQLLLKPRNFAYLVSGFIVGSIFITLLIVGVWLTNSQQQDLQSQAINTAFVCSQIDKIPNAECQALFQLYEKTQGENWVFGAGETRWFATNDPCGWTGVGCSSLQRITLINLNSKNLRGNLPPNIWGALAFLKNLDLSANQFLSGSLPQDMKYVILDSFKTKEANLCLPSQLDNWYLETENTDEIFDCDGYVNPLKTCNQDCNNNAECENNLLCYTIGDSHKCRLADNPSDDQCKQVNHGLDFTCNHYCADTSECSKDFTCWYNRCRQPENVESESCLLPASKLKSLMEQNCNQVCSSNANCVINMRCYQGACRLATHPNNSVCQAIAPIKPAQTKVVQKTPVAKSTEAATKGGLNQNSADNKSADQKIATPTPTTTQVIPTPTQQLTQKESTTTDLLDSVKEKLAVMIEKLSGANANLSQTEKIKNNRVGLGLLGGGVVLLILAKLIGNSKNPKKRLTQDHTDTTPPPSSMINRLKQKNVTPPKV